MLNALDSSECSMSRLSRGDRAAAAAAAAETVGERTFVLKKMMQLDFQVCASAMKAAKCDWMVKRWRERERKNHTSYGIVFAWQIWNANEIAKILRTMLIFILYCIAVPRSWFALIKLFWINFISIVQQFSTFLSAKFIEVPSFASPLLPPFFPSALKNCSHVCALQQVCNCGISRIASMDCVVLFAVRIFLVRFIFCIRSGRLAPIRSRYSKNSAASHCRLPGTKRECFVRCILLVSTVLLFLVWASLHLPDFCVSKSSDDAMERDTLASMAFHAIDSKRNVYK